MGLNSPPHASTWQGSASVIQTDALGESQEIAHLDMGHYFGEVQYVKSAFLLMSNTNLVPRREHRLAMGACFVIRLFASLILLLPQI